MLKQVLLVLALSIYQLNAEEGAARLLLAKQVNITAGIFLENDFLDPTSPPISPLLSILYMGLTGSVLT